MCRRGLRVLGYSGVRYKENSILVFPTGAISHRGSPRPNSFSTQWFIAEPRWRMRAAVGTGNALGSNGRLQDSDVMRNKHPPVQRQSVGQGSGFVRSLYTLQRSCAPDLAAHRQHPTPHGELTFWKTEKLTTGAEFQISSFPVFHWELVAQLRPGTWGSDAASPHPPLTPTRPTSAPEASPAPRGRRGHRTGTGVPRRATCHAR